MCNDWMDPRLLVLCTSDQGAAETAKTLSAMGPRLLGADHRPDNTQMLIFELPEAGLTETVIAAMQESDQVIDFESVRCWAAPRVVCVYTWRLLEQQGE